MKFVFVLSVFLVFAFVSQSVVSEIIKNNVMAHRWPTATVGCPAGKNMMGGGGRCVSLGGQGFVILTVNAPLNENAWKISCDTPEEQNVMAEVFIICE